MKGQEREVVMEGSVPATHGIVGRVGKWERGIGRNGARKWKKSPQSNALTVERGIKKKVA